MYIVFLTCHPACRMQSDADVEHHILVTIVGTFCMARFLTCCFTPHPGYQAHRSSQGSPMRWYKALIIGGLP